MLEFILSLNTLQNIPIVIDFLIVFAVIYRLLLLFKNTQTEYLIRGLFFLFVITFLSQSLGLNTLNWLLSRFQTVIFILVIIVFQPEIRRFLERVGSGHIFSASSLEFEGKSVVIKQLLKTIETCSEKKIGALIVLEMGTNLHDYIDSGVPIDSAISSDVLTSLFWPGTPTHDGAVIIRDHRIAAAGCLLPLTDTTLSDRRLGTRHRAAIGLSESSDALIIIVSEENGVISIAEKGHLNRFLNKEALETRLFNLYKEEKREEDMPLIKTLLKKAFKLK